jgi:alpha-glucosidase
LNLYKAALKLRKEFALGEGSFDWVSTSDLLTYRNGRVLVVHNFSKNKSPLPEGELLLRSGSGDFLEPNETAWVLSRT